MILVKTSSITLAFALMAASVSAASAVATAPPRPFYVRDFGAVADGETDAGNHIRAAIAAAKASGQPAEVLLEAGTYRVRPKAPREACFPIHQATNLVVRGAGKATQLVITDPASGGFGFGLCQQVMLRDLVVDYDPVPFCQGTVRAVDVQGGCFELEVDAGYPTPDAEHFLKAAEPYGKWGMIMDAATRRIRAGTPDHYMTPRWAYRWNSTEAMPDDVSNEDVVIESITDYSTNGLSANELAALVHAWQSGALSRDSMLDLFRRGEILPEGRTNDEETKLIDAEKSDLPPAPRADATSARSAPVL